MSLHVATLGHEDHFLRRVLNNANFLEWHDDFERWVPALAAVRFDTDGMSAFVRRLLHEHGHGPEDVSTLGGTSDKPAVVFEFDGAAVHEVGFSASLSSDEKTPIGYAHASVKNHP